MTVRELRELLEYAPDDAEVRLGSQPNYPFQWSVAGVVAGLDFALMDATIGDDPDAPSLSDFDGPVDPEKVVYVLEGRQLGYFPRAAWDMVR